MNTRGKCPNADCPSFGVAKSIAVGMLMGYGVGKDGAKCARCGTRLTITKAIRASGHKSERDRGRR